MSKSDDMTFLKSCAIFSATLHSQGTFRPIIFAAKPTFFEEGEFFESFAPHLILDGPKGEVQLSPLIRFTNGPRSQISTQMVCSYTPCDTDLASVFLDKISEAVMVKDSSRQADFNSMN